MEQHHIRLNQISARSTDSSSSSIQGRLTFQGSDETAAFMCSSAEIYIEDVSLTEKLKDVQLVLSIHQDKDFNLGSDLVELVRNALQQLLQLFDTALLTDGWKDTALKLSELNPSAVVMEKSQRDKRDVSFDGTANHMIAMVQMVLGTAEDVITASNSAGIPVIVVTNTYDAHKPDAVEEFGGTNSDHVTTYHSKKAYSLRDLILVALLKSGKLYEIKLRDQCGSTDLPFRFIDLYPGDCNSATSCEGSDEVIQQILSKAMKKGLFGHYLEQSLLKLPSTLLEITKEGNGLMSCHLFIWAVFNGQWSLAKSFWEETSSRLGSALLAAGVLKLWSDLAAEKHPKQFVVTLRKLAEAYEEVAITILDSCYNRDKEMSYILLKKGMPEWGNYSALLLARTFQLNEFMKCQCADHYFAYLIWYGQLDREKIRTVVFRSLFPVALLFPPLLYIFKYKDNERTTIDDYVARHEGGTPGGSAADFRSPTSKCKQLYTHAKYFFTAHFVKLSYQQLFYLLFLLFFSYFVMVELKPFDGLSNWSWEIEVLIYVWEIAVFVENLKVTILLWSQYRRIIGISIAIFVGLVLSAVLRFTLDASDFKWARFTFCLTIVLCYLRFTQFFSGFQSIGTRFYALAFMLLDLVLVMYILLYAILSYGVSAQALLYPEATLSASLIWNITFAPYWVTFGEIPVEDIQDDFYVSTFTACFTMFAGVLTINLLIAVFNDRYAEAKKQARTRTLKVHEYFVIEYYYKAPFPPPLSLLHLPYWGIITCYNRCRRRQAKYVPWLDETFSRQPFATTFERKHRIALQEFEDEIWTEHRKRIFRDQKLMTDDHVTSLLVSAEKSDFVSKRISERLSDQLLQTEHPRSYDNDELLPMIARQLLQRQEEMQAKLEEISRALQKS